MNKFRPNFQRKILFILVLAAIQVSFVFAQNAIKLSVDATDAPRNMLHVREIMPVSAGAFDLFYPKWIPGEHAPTGTLNNMVNLFITANGKPLAWRRDDVEMFAFHLTIPANVKEIEINFDDVSQPGTALTPNLARIKWNRLLIYPRALKSDDVQVAASLKMPNGWQYATALSTIKETKNSADFKETNLTTLVDSPAMIGKYFKKIPLTTENGAAVEMDIAAESADALEYQPETLAGWKNLVKQANAMFGARHYNNYKFLVSLSDAGGDEGLEHHESSEDGVGKKALSDPSLLTDLGDLLGHEYAHSWNGKFRRPATLTTPDFEQPMHGELLWVYEGLTEYLGRVLPARSGLWTAEMYRETLADTYAQTDLQTGRRWRPLVDTATAVQFTYAGERAWRNQRRGADYYYEGELIWLEADILIRQKSGGKLSLDDFLKKFHGRTNSAPAVVTYDLAEVVSTLNSVVAYDWQTFFNERVYQTQKNAPLGGITNGGWKLIYNDTPNTQTQVDEVRGNFLNLYYSIGIGINAEGKISDVNPDLAAAKAGIAPGMTVQKINGADFTADLLRQAIADTKTKAAPIKITAESGGATNDYTINYRGGAKYPHLVRDAAKTDYLSDTTKAR